MSKWIRFDIIKDTGITKIWEVVTQRDLPLGYVKWYYPWRRYCFFPIAGTVYAASCLRDIDDFMKREMKVRKKCNA